MKLDVIKSWPKGKGIVFLYSPIMLLQWFLAVNFPWLIHCLNCLVFLLASHSTYTDPILHFTLAFHLECWMPAFLGTGIMWTLYKYSSCTIHVSLQNFKLQLYTQIIAHHSISFIPIQKSLKWSFANKRITIMSQKGSR